VQTEYTLCEHGAVANPTQCHSIFCAVENHTYAAYIRSSPHRKCNDNVWGWPELYIHTAYIRSDRTETATTMSGVGQNRTYTAYLRSLLKKML